VEVKMNSMGLVGRCGLYCGACGIYRAYKDGGDYLLEVAKEFGIEPDKVRCEGCQALTPNCWGADCKIVQFLNEQGVTYMYECKEYEDRSFDEFENLAKRYAKIGVDVRANLEKIKAGKADEWLNEQAKLWLCPECGKPITCHKGTCHHCGAKLR